jgi:peptide/nickel transport system ATP-binding protein
VDGRRFIPHVFFVYFGCMQKALLEVNNFTLDFNGATPPTRAVNGISFSIAPGELVAVVGESGSGKSVTALSMLQLLPAAALPGGSMQFTAPGKPAVNILSLDKKAIRKVRGKDIAMIFQEPMTSLNPVFTCGSQVMEAIMQHQPGSKKAARQKVMELFAQVQLPEPAVVFNKYPHQLSGGQKQRVMIAMAISCNPALLIADEPTTALDVTVQQSILQLIKQLQQQQGMSVLLITHDLGLVADVADKVVVLYKGQIVEQGAAATVLQQPAHAYTKALLQCRPALHARGSRLPVVGDALAGTTILPALQPENSKLASPAAGIALQVQELQVHYPGKRNWPGRAAAPFKAVDGVSFAVSNGETLGLVGESGCGKTTLGRAILQLIPATSGNILLNGQNLTAMPAAALRHLRKELQVVFQDPYGSLNPRLTIGDAIAEPMQVHGLYQHSRQRKDKVVELLQKVNLQAAHVNRYPHEFSGGQRQRICIARALALNPSFIIFDESVSALDVSVQAQVLNLLNDLKADFGFTSIFISHDLSVVRYISDRILVMQQGKIVEEGPAEQVYLQPSQPYTRRLINAIPGKSLLAMQ